jgi:NADH-quinone oxidoreductase subunit L
MFVGWEGVGLCSYLLISFYSEDRSNVVAGNKAFIVNRIGDLGFVLGMAFLFWGIGSSGFDYLSLANQCRQSVTGHRSGCLPAVLCRCHR